MPRCSKCGKVNREGALFCQDCGTRLEGASAPTPAVKPAGASPTSGAQPLTCSACGTVNPAGMNFCKMCGTPLVAKPAAAAADAAAGRVNCPACGKQTPAGFAFCQHCGQRLQPAQPAAPPAAASPPIGHASTVAASGPLPGMPGAAPPGGGVHPTPPAGVPRQVAPAPAPSPSTVRPAAAPVPADDAHAATMAPPASAADAAQLAAQLQAQVRASAGRPSVNGAITKPEPTPFGRLVMLKRDGSDGDTVLLAGPSVDVGRLEGDVRFAEDPYLAPRHARLAGTAGKVTVTPLDQVNGIYLRLRGPFDLQPGDQILVGKEVLRFEPLAPEEREPPSLVEHGVRLFGSAPREAWARLRQLTVAGTARDVWHLTRPELVLGREEGDVTFPDDEFMSRRHASVRRVGAKARLEDLGSSNGTYIRLRGERQLESGDVLRMGDQLVRFES